MVESSKNNGVYDLFKVKKQIDLSLLKDRGPILKSYGEKRSEILYYFK